MPPPGSAAGYVPCPCSASAIVGETVAGQHLLHIDGYSRTLEELPTGKSFRPRPFRVGDLSWSVSYYPNGQNSKYAEFISVLLRLDVDEGVAASVKARAVFSLLHAAGKPTPSYTTSTSQHEYSVGGGSGFGFFDFIHQEGVPGEVCISFGRLPHDQLLRHYFREATQRG
ncbi:hypothetical protein BAE44_0000583 [Dichanthelium oligosanthes]|uniref:MATH domain-containing protein n=1 Tax=Dichanthelium oligosanthes TaxID=888268 RepID=A0A1E5WM01_9POAL|nr:hypothetical protein BAE44_0000583 [Dichanthelium oligosanthes]